MKTAEQLQAELDAATQRANALEAAERKRATDQRHADNASFADNLISQARWPAGAKDVLVATLNLASEPGDAGLVSFGEGDAAKPLHQVLRDELAKLPQQVSFGEVAGRGSQATGGDLVSFSDQPGYEGVNVAADRLELDKRIKQYMAEHKVDYATAASKVSK